MLRRWARGQAEIVWLLTGLFVGVLLLAVLLSFQRLTAMQRNGQAVLTGALQAAVRDGLCDTTSSTDAQEMNQTLAETAFVQALDTEAKAIPEGSSSSVSALPVCAVGVSSSQPGQVATYTLTYSAQNPFVGPFTVTLAIYEPNQVGQPLPGAPGLTAQQPGIYALMVGPVNYVVAGLHLETFNLKTAVFERVSSSPPAVSGGGS